MTASASPLTHLTALAKDRARRGALMRALAELFVAGPDRFNGAARDLLDDVLLRLCDAAGPDDRRALAIRLADAPQAPPALMRRLARETLDIAAPVLKRCAALDEKALAAIAANAGEDRLILLAGRALCPPALAAAIAARGGETALLALAENEKARLAPETLDALIAKARRSQALRQAMIARLDLSPQALMQLYFLASPPGRKDILKRAALIEPALAGGAAAANRKAALTSGEGDRLGAARALVRQAVRAGGAQGRLLQDLIEKDQPAAFMIAFAYFAGVDAAAAKTILNDPRGEAQAIACRAADLPRPMFAKILFLKLKSPEGDEAAARMLDLYLKIPRDAADKLMRFWRVRGRTGRAAPARPAPVEALMRAAG